ncbi:LacI family DNA-binding transcriptional regulator [Hirschia baltica]|uniref:Transcriptional regulator, LacI family n=1 Tax=Hirschia baltica (strain ATCC 49814 / DSM 5838 / IFAM 1418) TaxID=582402 RepID=C6XQJ1_HIRBI|nr:LacI family DNA-binding transcriptional regulator [Hirschia baltica]ACT60490.1 transcriptional regulator, LacI family [Hirschia baltica ATCC 49814]
MSSDDPEEFDSSIPNEEISLSKLAASKDRSRSTINDVARLAQVSKKTVSRVINGSPSVREETRVRVKQIIKEIGFTPDPQARALAMRKSMLIGMVYDNPSPQYLVNMQRGILEGLVDTDYLLVLIVCERGDLSYREKVENFVIQQRPMGLILTPSVSEDDNLAEILREHDCDYVRIASVDVDEPSRMIRSLDFDGAADAGRHLAQLGHKRIGHIHGPKTFFSQKERIGGLRAGLAEFDVMLSDDLVVEGAYTYDSGKECMAKLLSAENIPTAVFLGNDEMAMGAYSAAREVGLRIPDDISIVGYDDTPMAKRMWPPMTTVKSPIRATGKAAAELLRKKAAKIAIRELETFRPEIVIRGSTCPPK